MEQSRGRTNVGPINDWIRENGPDGCSRLAIGSGVSRSLISRLRSEELPFPKRLVTRLKISQFLELSHEEMFPGVAGPSSSKEREKAS